MPVPTAPKIYHILHMDRLRSIVSDGHLWSDAEAIAHGVSGTSIGIKRIKQHRLNKRQLNSHPELFVGQCVPFYLCPRSVMLYLIAKRNHPGLTYRGGQEPIVHLEADLRSAVQWAEMHGRRWAFTTSNAGSRAFDDYADISLLSEIKWEAVQARQWWDPEVKHGKQAEFLVERSFPWGLFTRIGVHNQAVARQVHAAMDGAGNRPLVLVKRNWYY